MILQLPSASLYYHANWSFRFTCTIQLLVRPLTVVLTIGSNDIIDKLIWSRQNAAAQPVKPITSTSYLHCSVCGKTNRLADVSYVSPIGDS